MSDNERHPYTGRPFAEAVDDEPEVVEEPCESRDRDWRFTLIALACAAAAGFAGLNGGMTKEVSATLGGIVLIAAFTLGRGD